MKTDNHQLTTDLTTEIVFTRIKNPLGMQSKKLLVGCKEDQACCGDQGCCNDQGCCADFGCCDKF